MVRSHAISNAKFCGRKNFSKFSIRNALRIARNLTCRGVPTRDTMSGDLFCSRRGLASSSGANFGAISRDSEFERKILRPRKSFEIFGRESHEISRAATCRRPTPCLGTSLARGEAVRRQAELISMRSHAISNARFCGRENFSKFSVENRTKSHAPQRADARHHVWGPLLLAVRLCVVKRS